MHPSMTQTCEASWEIQPPTEPVSIWQRTFYSYTIKEQKKKKTL